MLCLALPVTAQSTPPSLCSDTDDGGKDNNDPALGKKGSVKYGITSMEDTCLTSQEGVSTNSSRWLKEYYCTSGTDTKRESEVYECSRSGFTKCELGACVGGSAAESLGNETAVKPKAPVQACGDERIAKDKGEECDPPGKICFGKTSKQYGICDALCKCKLAASAEQSAPECGDGTVDDKEECEADSDCAENFVCSSCSCVKKLTEEEIEAMKREAKGEKEQTSSEEEKEAEKATPEINTTPKDFSNDGAMKVTSGIARFFKGIFGWLASLFS